VTDHAKKLAAAVEALIPAAEIAAEMLRCLGDERAAVVERAKEYAQRFLDEYRAGQAP
jgi:hypothetical protein